MEEKEHEKATFAGGCFWCVQEAFDSLPGVIATVAGYTGGSRESPSYEEVCTGETGHVEALQILYDPQKITYEKLLSVFWHTIDPTDQEGQFADKGKQYRTKIFYHNEKQKHLAEESKKKLLIEAVYTEILPAVKFYPAEEYHQEYYRKNPLRYHFYREGCGRDKRLKQIWKL